MAQAQWVDKFRLVQQQEARDIQKLKGELVKFNINLEEMSHKGDQILQNTDKIIGALQQLLNDKTSVSSPSLEASPEGTHPSDHNSVILVDNANTAASRRVREAAKRARMQQCDKDVAKGHADSWAVIQKRRQLEHEQAFLRPIPYWGVSDPYFGLYG